MAVIYHGFLRATEDIDVLLADSPANIASVREALMTLPDQAILEMAQDDLERYTVVRVVDDIVVDLMLATCGITYHEAASEIEWAEVGSVRIPFASAPLLLRMKQTLRQKDALDRQFLERKLAGDDSSRRRKR